MKRAALCRGTLPIPTIQTMIGWRYAPTRAFLVAWHVFLFSFAFFSSFFLSSPFCSLDSGFHQPGSAPSAAVAKKALSRPRPDEHAGQIEPEKKKRSLVLPADSRKQPAPTVPVPLGKPVSRGGRGKQAPTTGKNEIRQFFTRTDEEGELLPGNMWRCRLCVPVTELSQQPNKGSTNLLNHFRAVHWDLPSTSSAPRPAPLPRAGPRHLRMALLNWKVYFQLFLLESRAAKKNRKKKIFFNPIPPRTP